MFKKTLHPLFQAAFILLLAAPALHAEDAAVPAAPAASAPVAKEKPVRKRRMLKTNASTSAVKPASAVKVDDVQTSKKSKARESFEMWLKEMKKRVARSQTRQNQLVAVAAVRGAETQDTPPLYWKGKKAEGPVEAPELKDFEAALETSMAGDPAAAKEKLQAFILAYPKSSMAPDAKETLNRLENASVQP